MLSKNLIWDLDGTVIDTRKAMAKSYEITCGKMGLQEDNFQRIFVYVGQRASKIFVDQFDLKGEAFDTAAALNSECFLSECLKLVTLYPGMKELLHDLKQQGARLTVATARKARSLYPLLEATGLADTFDFITCPQDSSSLTDKPGLVRRCIDYLQVPAEDCVMIGDRIFDIEGGQKNNTMTIGVTYGFGEMEEVLSCGTTFIAHDVSQLRHILMEEHKR